MSQKPIKGLRERILDATSDAEIKTLLEEGGTYTDASDITRRRWHTAAKQRRDELGVKSK